MKNLINLRSDDKKYQKQDKSIKFILVKTNNPRRGSGIPNTTWGKDGLEQHP